MKHEYAVARLEAAGEGWWQVALIVGIVGVLAGGFLGYQSATGTCDPVIGCTEAALIGAFLGGVLGVLPALPLMAIAHLHRHLAAIEQARGAPADVPVAGSDAHGA